MNWIVFLVAAFLSISFEGEAKEHFPILQDAPKYDERGCSASDMEAQALLLRECHGKKVIFDLGAKEGAWTEMVLKFAKTPKIFAFEPDEEAYDKLSKKLKDISDLFCLKMGFEFDAFCKNNDIEEIDFLRINLEGKEWDILQAAHTFLKNKKIEALQFHYGKDFKNRVTLKQIYDYLTSLNYQVYRLCHEGLIYIAEWRPALENSRESIYFARPPKGWRWGGVFLKEILKPNDLVFDLGANKGEKTALFLDLGARVVNINPLSDVIGELRKKYRDHPKFQIEYSGVGAKKGHLTLNRCLEDPTFSSFSDKWKKKEVDHLKSWEKKRDVPVTTLDDLIAKYGQPKLCNLDVRGYEYRVLTGLHTPIDYLTFEYTQQSIEDTQKAMQQLKALGYRKFNYTKAYKPALILEEWVDGDVILDEIDNSWVSHGYIIAHYETNK